MYVVLEGIDGTGKSTQVSLLKEWFEYNGFDVKTTTEPTNECIGGALRDLMSSTSSPLSMNKNNALGLLFAADRLMMMDELESLLVEDVVVLSDRSYYSSIAYMDSETWAREINKYALEPDIVIVLDMDAKKAVERCCVRDCFENEEVLTRARRNYLSLAESDERVHVIDADQSVVRVFFDIVRVVEDYIIEKYI